MNLCLTDEETAALLRELDSLIDGDRYFMSQCIKTLNAIRGQDKAGADARAVASAAEAICAAAGDREAETECGASSSPSGELLLGEFAQICGIM